MKRFAVTVGLSVSILVIVAVAVAVFVRSTDDTDASPEVGEPFLTETEVEPFEPKAGSGGQVVEPSPIGSRCGGTATEVSVGRRDNVDLMSAVAIPNEDGNIVRIVAASFALEVDDVSVLGIDGPDDAGAVLDLTLFRFAGTPLQEWTAFEVPPVLGNEFTFNLFVHGRGTTEGFGEDLEGDLTLLQTGEQWCVDIDLRDSTRQVSGVVVARTE